MESLPAFFLDRDGVLNEVGWREGKPVSPRNASEFRLRKGVLEMIQAIKAASYRVIVITNQPDIERGLLAPAELEVMHASLQEAIEPDDILVAISGDDAHPWRKPNPGMLLEAARRWALDLTKCYFIGDTEKDLEAGRRASVTTILMESTYNLHLRERADFTLASPLDAAQWISRKLCKAPIF